MVEVMWWLSKAESLLNMVGVKITWLGAKRMLAVSMISMVEDMVAE